MSRSAPRMLFSKSSFSRAYLPSVARCPALGSAAIATSGPTAALLSDRASATARGDDPRARVKVSSRRNRYYTES